MNPMFQNRGLSLNQTLQAKQCCVELKDLQPALVPLRKVVFTTESFRRGMSLGLKLLTMARFYRPLPITPDICIRVPSTCTCWPLSPATTTWYTLVPVFMTLSSPESNRITEIYFLLSSRYPYTSVWRSS